MASFTRSRWCRSIALLLALAVLHSAPGLAAYSALAANLKAAPAAVGHAVSPVRVPALGSAVLTAPHNALTPLALAGSLNTAPAPVLNAPSAAPEALPSAALAAPVVAAPLSRAAAVVPAAAASLHETAAAVETAKPSAAGLSAMPALGRYFDGWRARPDAVSPVTAPHDAPAFKPLTAPADAPESAANTPPAPPTGPDGPAAPGRARVTVGLAMAVAGGVGAWYAAPVLVPLLLSALAHVPYVTVPALPLLAYEALLALLGAGAGLSAFHTRTWKDFPAGLRDDAVGAARTTFRFWARFGLIFDAVLRGKPTDEVMKGDVSANILTYPLIAWLFVAAGYALTPVAFVLGAAWRVVGTPILAALRGAHDVAVGFFPWLGRVLRLIGRVLRNIVPFVVGFVWGGLRGLFYGGLTGAVILSSPLYRDVVSAKYAPTSLPGWLGYRLLQLAGLIATAVLGLAGFVVGVLVSPLHALLSALEAAFGNSRVSEPATDFFRRWLKALREDAAFPRLLERALASEAAETLNTRRVRLANHVLIASSLLFALPFLSLATLFRSLKAAFTGADVAPGGGDWKTGRPAPGAERPVDANPAGPVIPAVVGALGAVGGVLAYAAFAPALGLGLLLGLAAWTGAGALGAALGLALSQLNALVVIPGRALSDTKDGATLAWGGWTDAGRRAVAAVLGTEKASWLGALLAAIPGAVLAVLSGLTSVVYAVATGLVKASWTGLLELARRYLPALRRLLDWAVRVLKNILPFAFGFLWGAVVGLFKTAFVTAVSFFKPVIEAFEAEDSKSRPSEAQIGAGILMGLTLLPLALAVFVGGLAMGATLGLPVILTFGLARGMRWADLSEKSVAYWRAWERAIDRAAQEALNAVSGVFAGVGPEMPVWRLYVRVASVLLGSPVTAFVVLAAGAKAYVKSFSYARVIADGGQIPPVTEPTAPSIENPETPAATPVGKTPVALTAVMGALGLAAGLAAMYFMGPAYLMTLVGWQLWTGYALVFAGLPLAGLATGLTLSQRFISVATLSLMVEHGGAGLVHSYAYWRNSTDSALKHLFGVERGSIFGYPSRAVGGILGALWGIAGMAYGAGAAFLVGAYAGAKQVVYEMLPFLRTAFETAMKVLRRAVPFVFGLVGGFVAGVVGSAAFGALLLGRPYFKHVVAEDFEKRGALGALGNVLLKLVAGVLGVLFGLGGAVIGLLVAVPYALVAAVGAYFGMTFGPLGVALGVLVSPYALTAAVALALRFADIGGPVQRFFDHWSYGALREEMRRINQLTSKFKFEDAPEGREPSLASGWIRIANILPATIAAVFAAGVAGLVSYVRSLINAYKTSTSGAPIPEPTVDERSRREWDRTWSRAGRTARGFFGWAITGAMVGAAIWTFSSWAPLGLAGWLLVGAAAGAGALLALGLATVIAVVALFVWIGGQLR